MRNTSVVRKRRVRCKRAMDNTFNHRRSSHLCAKERATFELPAEHASRVQAELVDFEGASKRLISALQKTKLLTNLSSLSDDEGALEEVAAACVASDEEIILLRGATAGPSTCG